MATVFDRVKDVVVDRLGSDGDTVQPEASFVDDLNAGERGGGGLGDCNWICVRF